MRRRSALLIATGLSAFMAGGGAQMALAEDTLRLTVGQRGLWDTSISEVGQRSGIFKKHGLTLEILWTQGSGETQQAVIAGSVEIGTGVGIMGVLSAYSKGAPVRIIGNEMTGAGPLFCYAKPVPPKKPRGAPSDKTLPYPTNAPPPRGVAPPFEKKYAPAANPPPPGGPPAPLTAVM